MMRRKISVIFALLMVAVFSAQAFAVGPKSRRPIEVTIQDIEGVWEVAAKEILIVGDLDAKKVKNPASIEFFSDDQNDPVNGSFSFTNSSEGLLLGFQADCYMANRGAKIVWHITDQENLEKDLVKAISDWVAQNGKKLIDEPALDIRLYAYKPIVVIKRTASPKFGMFQAKGTVTLTAEDGEEGQITEVVNFKYQCHLKFGSRDSADSAASDDSDFKDF
jgi:hypothetical protein